MATLVNRTELAGAFGISLPTVDSWRQQGMPAKREGAKGSQWVFDLDEVKAWRAGRDAALQAEVEAKRKAVEELQAELDLRRSAGDPADQLPLNMREQYYRAEQKRQGLARERGFLVETAEVRRQFDAAFGYLADRLQALPDRLERHCGLTPDVVDELAGAIDEMQSELARALQQADLDGQRDQAA